MNPVWRRGFTLVELLIVCVIIACLAGIGIPKYLSALENARVIKAVMELKTISQAIEMHRLRTGSFPASLAEVGITARRDPWGRPYQYLNIEERILSGVDPEWDEEGNWVGNLPEKIRLPVELSPSDRLSRITEAAELVSTAEVLEANPRPELRKSASLFPLNSDFDLYSLGSDGKTSSKINTKEGMDDVIRANDGKYFGLASSY